MSQQSWRALMGGARGTHAWHRKRSRKWLWWLLAAILLLLGAAAAFGWYLQKIDEQAAAIELPSSFADYNPTQGLRIYGADGTQLAHYTEEKREILPYEAIPPRLLLAFIAAEDADFFFHDGVSFKAVARAMIENIKAGRIVQGGSTITQQLVKGMILRRSEKVYGRKLVEAAVARRLEKKLGKRDILALYVNHIFLGQRAYGVQAAAKRYFGRPVWDLHLGEMAVLAGLPPAPSNYSPVRSLPAAKERQRYVLDRMLTLGFITERERDEALERPLTIAAVDDTVYEQAPHWTEYIRKRLTAEYGEAALRTGSYDVITSLDLPGDWTAHDAVWGILRDYGKRVGWSGPLARLGADEGDVYRERFARYYGDVVQRGRVYPAFVEGKGAADVRLRVGGRRCRISAKHLTWARKPDPIRSNQGPISVKEALARFTPGDIVLARVSDTTGIDDYLSRAPLPAGDDDLLCALEQTPPAEAALAAKDVRTGYVRAMIAGYNFEASQFDRVHQACRQPGSSFKPIVYSAAIDKGWAPGTMIFDSPIVTRDENMAWKPQSYDGQYRGEVTMRDALVNSLNIPAIMALRHVGTDAVAAHAKQLGITSNLDHVEGLALGSSCVVPDDMVNAFAVYARNGRKLPDRAIIAVYDAAGRRIYDNRHPADPALLLEERIERAAHELLHPDPEVLDPRTAYMTTRILQDVTRAGTASRASSLNRPTAGKTGTTNESFDAWFVGFTPQIAAAVWIGYDKNERPLGGAETGAKAALPAWIEFVGKYLGTSPPGSYAVPAGIQEAVIDLDTGLRARPDSPRRCSLPFRDGEVPQGVSVAPGEADPEQLMKQD